MLRGAFGHALRHAVCAMGPDQACYPCPLRSNCVYPRLFETFLDDDPPPFLEGLKTAPRPYVFEPLSEDREFAPGDVLAFDLLLIGQAVELQAYAVLAVERMAPRGLGRRAKRFRLVRVGAPGSETVLYEGGSWKSREPVGATEAPSALPDVESVDLVFETPVRFTRDGEPVEAFRFRKFTFQMLRRVLELAHCHVPGAEPDWHFKPLLVQASEVDVERDLSFYDWERYSNRQRRHMRLGGWVGKVRLTGDLKPFAKLLRTVEVVHVGKGTTFGLGRVRVVDT